MLAVYARIIATVTISSSIASLGNLISRCLYNMCLSCVCAVSHRERCHKTMDTQDIVQDENRTMKL